MSIPIQSKPKLLRLTRGEQVEKSALHQVLAECPFGREIFRQRIFVLIHIMTALTIVFIEQRLRTRSQLPNRGIFVVPALVDDILNLGITIHLWKFHVLQQVHNFRSMLPRIFRKTLIPTNLKSIVY